jgi:hypothetical protein
MIIKELKPCPFCGDIPTISDPEWMDDRRYIAIDIICCIKMKILLGWEEAKDLSSLEIEQNLKEEAIKEWNTRTDRA